MKHIKQIDEQNRAAGEETSQASSHLRLTLGAIQRLLLIVADHDMTLAWTVFAGGPLHGITCT